MRDFKKLVVWAKAHELTLAVYTETDHFPKEERYGLTSQIRRAAASIAANIVEGHGRHSDPELHRFLQISRGSACELEYHLILARDLGYLKSDRHQKLQLKLEEVERMLTSFAQSVAPLPKARQVTAASVR